MNKKITTLLLLLLVSCVFASMAFGMTAGTYQITFQIINADTFEVIQNGKLDHKFGANGNITRWLRNYLGFPSDSADRTANGVKQRLLIVSTDRIGS
jgi:hypothetical protein